MSSLKSLEHRIQVLMEEIVDEKVSSLYKIRSDYYTHLVSKSNHDEDHLFNVLNSCDPMVIVLINRAMSNYLNTIKD